MHPEGRGRRHHPQFMGSWCFQMMPPGCLSTFLSQGTKCTKRCKFAGNWAFYLREIEEKLQSAERQNNAQVARNHRIASMEYAALCIQMNSQLYDAGDEALRNLRDDEDAVLPPGPPQDPPRRPHDQWPGDDIFGGAAPAQAPAAPFIPEAIAGPSRLTRPAQQPAAPCVPEAIAGPSRLVPAQPPAIAGPSRLAPPEPLVDEPVLLPRARSRSPVANRPRARSRSPIAGPARRRSPAPVRRQRRPRSPPRHMRSEKEEAAHEKKNKFAFLREALERARAQREQERLWRENPALRPTRRARSHRPPPDHQVAFMPDTVARQWRMEPQQLRRFPNVDRIPAPLRRLDFDFLPEVPDDRLPAARHQPPVRRSLRIARNQRYNYLGPNVGPEMRRQ
ncbi:hypothetical protein JTE90_007594 [Oedothorax gibbosus]|uniref:Uncharacterized protein n=1 Tax=Oedothorax gibbosus TaxID=931172 RepID=A0AAV6U7U4_9ARAC|nr:hypothetical protein JTE90_007594 [Oedothorax gibbosus]